jgi:ribosomal protein L34
MAEQQHAHRRTMPAGGGPVNAPRRAGHERVDLPHLGRYAPRPDSAGSETVRAGASPSAAMKLKVRRSKMKRLKQVGFRTRSKTAGGRKVIKRKIRRSGKFRVG